MKQIILLIAAIFATLSLSASSLKLSYNTMDNNGYTKQKDNIGLELGHYINKDKQGFGLGWRAAVTTPIQDDWLNGGTAEGGIAPGYTLLPELNLKAEFGIGMTSYNSYEVGIGAYVGAGLDYVLFKHMVLGIAVRNWFMNAKVKQMVGGYEEDVTVSYSDMRSTAYIGYRF